MKILGIDPGYAIMGYGIIEKKGSRIYPVVYGALETDKNLPMPDRLKHLYSGLMDVITEYEPEELSIEQLYFQNNAKTAIFVGQARGVAILSAANSGMRIFEYTPMEIKTSVTGYGKADKKQVQEMVKTILGFDHIIEPDDTSDALAAAICHSYQGELKKKLYEMK
jgi:crossover junction endodeoxyribonuclease RuvC